jgi:hypothetical protein
MTSRRVLAFWSVSIWLVVAGPAATQEPSNRYTTEAGWSVDLTRAWDVLDKRNVAEFEKMFAESRLSSDGKEELLAPVRAGSACMFYPTPTVAVDDTIRLLRDAWLQLGTRGVDPVDVVALIKPETGNVRFLELRVVQHLTDIRIVESTGDPENLGFVWSNTKQPWRFCSGLMDPFLEHGRPGHQYLTEDMEPLVEVSFRE